VPLVEVSVKSNQCNWLLTATTAVGLIGADSLGGEGRSPPHIVCRHITT